MARLKSMQPDKAPVPAEREVLRRWELVVPRWRPSSTNELLRGVRPRIRRKKMDREIIAVESIVQRLPVGFTAPERLKVPPRRVSLRITLGPRNKPVDPDNLLKSLLDACVHAGLLRDDSHQFCEFGGVEYIRGDRLETTVIIEDIETEG